MVSAAGYAIGYSVCRKEVSVVEHVYRIVFFYSRKDVLRDYKEEGLNTMHELDDFIIYEKGELAQVIKAFISEQGE